MSTKSITSQSSEDRIKQLEQELAKTRSELQTANADLQTAHAELADAHAGLDAAHVEEPETHINLALTDQRLTQALDAAAALRGRMETMINGTELSESERRSMMGSGVRRYGFTDKVSDMIDINPDLVPQYLDEERLKELLRQLEVVRNINAILLQTVRMNSDIMLVLGDEAYRMALMFYGAVRDASIRRVPGARELYHILRDFFRRRHRATDEPTEHQTLRDARALIHGTKDGELIIRNERPHATGGIHEVIDDTHKAKAEWKATESGEFDE